MERKTNNKKTKKRVKEKSIDVKKFNSKLNNNIKEKKKFNKSEMVAKIFTKVNITYFVLFLIDIIFAICFARQNVVHYVVVLKHEIFVSKTRYLLFGRNYINLILIAFFYLYICLVNKFFLRRKNTKKFLLLLFISLSILNILLFFIFTKRVY